MPRSKVLSGRSEPVYRYIVQQIFSGRLAQGERINEMQIAEACGTSRTPVHQALKQLELDGIVSIVPNKGVEVVTLTEESVHQIGELQLLFGWITAKLAMHNGSAAEFLALQKLAQECRADMRSDDLETRIGANTRFYMEMAAIGKNSVMMPFLRKLFLQAGLVLAERYRDGDACEKQSQMHFEIINALLEQDMGKFRDSILPQLVDLYGIEDFYAQIQNGQL
ncbi:GntR family transcriptional regulator [Intestinibacillus massiliensis]|uniref:GntR family transcriptional regulator n=1 Tax=Intestinibacillus massiliensis TaxID=1871029 RepID=UPI000B34EC7D|nr:GntR family transcriptional regulator [Intestinibacillus massiliensis]